MLQTWGWLGGGGGGGGWRRINTPPSTPLSAPLKLHTAASGHPGLETHDHTLTLPGCNLL